MDTEMKVKKRDWVKNAAIIFLAVMLALTFFSNTIMNRSLPEVAAQNVISGEITSKVRGTGNVTANQSYEVTLPQTREIKTVRVKQGDEVKEGDILFKFYSAIYSVPHSNVCQKNCAVCASIRFLTASSSAPSTPV